MEKLTLNDLLLGNIDAKHELLKDSSNKEKDAFRFSFFVPENIVLDDFYTGRKCFIEGHKGTGKTALLRFLALGLEDQGVKTHFLLFKSDVKDDDRKEIAKHVNTTVAENDHDVDLDDYTDAWLIFLFGLIVQQMKEKNARIVAENESWRHFEMLIHSIEPENRIDKVRKLIPKLKNGTLELKFGTENNYAKLSAQVEWDDEQKTKVKPSNLSRTLKALFRNFQCSNFPDDALYVFIDELEISFGKVKQYNRDVKLIRDLICAVAEINTLCVEVGVRLKVITAVRKEVLTLANAKGKEINKLVSDFGTIVNWNLSSSETQNHPLSQIIYKRLLISEIKKGLKENQSSADLWGKYFPAVIGDQKITDFILNLTWYRPRDIVRLLTLCKKLYPNETMFSQKILEGVLKEYSTQSWDEYLEELAASFGPEQLDGVEKLLSGSKAVFSMNDFLSNIEKKRKLYNEVDKLATLHMPATILSILFRIGIIGNFSGNRFRFAFRGDSDILLEQNIVIHRALRKKLSVTS